MRIAVAMNASAVDTVETSENRGSRRNFSDNAESISALPSATITSIGSAIASSLPEKPTHFRRNFGLWPLVLVSMGRFFPTQQDAQKQ